MFLLNCEVFFVDETKSGSFWSAEKYYFPLPAKIYLSFITPLQYFTWPLYKIFTCYVILIELPKLYAQPKKLDKEKRDLKMMTTKYSVDWYRLVTNSGFYSLDVWKGWLQTDVLVLEIVLNRLSVVLFRTFSLLHMSSCNSLFSASIQPSERIRKSQGKF